MVRLLWETVSITVRRNALKEDQETLYSLTRVLNKDKSRRIKNEM